MGDVYTTRYDSLQLKIVLNSVLAPFAAMTRFFDPSKPDEETYVSFKSIWWCKSTHGRAASEMTPVFRATMPNWSCSVMRVARLMSCVKMYAARPTSQSFAMDSTASSVSNENTGAMGANISSLQTRMSAVTLLKMVGSKKFGPGRAMCQPLFVRMIKY